MGVDRIARQRGDTLNAPVRLSVAADSYACASDRRVSRPTKCCSSIDLPVPSGPIINTLLTQDPHSDFNLGMLVATSQKEANSY